MRVFDRRTLRDVVQNWRPFTKRGYPKRTWGACHDSLEDTNATWTEYQGIKEAVLARGLIIEKCKPKGEATPPAPTDAGAEHVRATTQHTRAIAEAAAETLAPAVGAAGMSEDAMHSIADLLFKRLTKGKDKE